MPLPPPNPKNRGSDDEIYSTSRRRKEREGATQGVVGGIFEDRRGEEMYTPYEVQGGRNWLGEGWRVTGLLLQVYVLYVGEGRGV